MAGLKPIKTKNTAAAEAEVAEEEEEVEPLSPGARIFHTPQLNCCIISEIGCKTAVDAEVVKGGVKLTLLKHPRFCSKLVFDSKDTTKPIGWVRTMVNIDDHVLVPDFDPNIDSPDKFVEDYKYNLTKTPMDFTKPLWELHILNIKTSQAKCIAIFRIHHSIGDGISLTSLLLACTRKTSDSEALPTLPVSTKKPRTRIQTKGRPLGFLWQWFLKFLVVLKFVRNTLIDLVLFLATMLWLKDSDTPLKGSYGNEQHPRRFVHRMLSLDDIKMVKNATNATINDVVLGITQAGLSRYLNKSYGMAKGHDQENNIPKNLRLRATLLVNLRPTSSIEGLAEMMEGNSKRRWSWGNSIGYIILPFHVGLKDDPLDYIRDAKATIDRKKQSLEAPATYASAKLVLKMIGLRVIARLTYNVLLNTTMSFSNVVGPLEHISFYGYPLTYLAPSVYGHPQALTVHFQSYVNKMILVLAVDEKIIPDPHVLCDYFEESLRFAKNAAVKKEIVNS